MAVALNHTTSRDCKCTKCIQTFMGKMAIVALSTEWHWRRAWGSASLSLSRFLLSCSAFSCAKQAVCQPGSRCHANFFAGNHAADTRWIHVAHFSVYRSTAIRFLEMPRRFFVVEQDARIVAVTSGKGEHVRARHGWLAKITGIKNKQRKRWCFCWLIKQKSLRS